MYKKLKEVRALEDYKILLIFKDGEKRIYDAKKLLKYEFFKNIKDEKNFKSLKIVDGITIEWETGEDIDPDELYEDSILIK